MKILLRNEWIMQKNEIELIKNSEFINYIVINDVLEKSSIEFESNVKQLYPNFFI